MPEKNRFADVLLPLPLPGVFTYSITEEQHKMIAPGCRVAVQFGRKKLYTGVVVKVHGNKPEAFAVKDILSAIDDKPVVNSLQLKLWDWISEYYMCFPGDVVKAALPAGLKLESETRVFPKDVPDYKIRLDEFERSVFEALLKYNDLSIQRLTSLFHRKDLLTVVKSMAEKGIVILEEHLHGGYIPKKETFIRQSFDSNDPGILEGIFKELDRSPKQLESLMVYLALVKKYGVNSTVGIEKGELLRQGATSQTIQAIIKKGFLTSETREVGRIPGQSLKINEPTQLNNAQTNALREIKEQFTGKNAILLHGVTSSGKTEIYIHLIREQIEMNKQVLYLLPEIALTTQIIVRLKSVFGNKVGVYHSKFTDHERVEVWKNLLGDVKPDQEQYQVILGVRSSVFLPFSNLGLIIVDEEHENTYKQFDPAPRYHARDTAIILASLHRAKTLLGSATPSLESYQNAITGKYALVELNERYLNLEMPEIKVADVREARKKKQMQSIFTPMLLNSIEKALDNHEQVILFQNRRGFSPYLECDICGWIPVCIHCDVSLTYHKKSNRLICHYCGYSVKNPKSCQHCGGVSLLTRGFGTEKVEDELAILFPGTRIARLDLDSARNRKSYEEIISGFETGRISILVGTQMVSKGLDFNNVKVVGILNADNMLHFPDFRSYERSYQLMSQVSGRAGRRYSKGLVIIQTSDRENTIIRNVVNNDYLGMFRTQLEERRQFKYPPFYRLIEITLKHKNPGVLERASGTLAKRLKTESGLHVIGPEFPLISRIHDYTLKRILIKLPKNHDNATRKKRLSDAGNDLLSGHDFHDLHINFDVDPM